MVGNIAELDPQDGVQNEQHAQIDSKDISFEVLAALASCVQHLLAQDGIQGVVVTHGTDTLEETAYFLQAVLAPAKPVVLTCAMRPASALAPEGPQNMLDAEAVARHEGGQGVVVVGVGVVCNGAIHSAFDVQKIHTYQLNAFGSGNAAAIGFIEEKKLILVKNLPIAQRIRARAATENIAKISLAKPWPQVEIVMSYAGATGALVDVLLAQGVQGRVVAGTCNGTVRQALEAALLKAQNQGVLVVRATRCTQGRVLAKVDDRLPTSYALSPVKARIELMLRLMLTSSYPAL